MGVFTINAQGQDVWTDRQLQPAAYADHHLGQAGDIPVPGDYDGIGYDEPAVYRPSTGQFMVLQQN